MSCYFIKKTSLTLSTITLLLGEGRGRNLI